MYIFVIRHFILYAKSKGLVTVVPDETATISLFEARTTVNSKRRS